LVLIEAVVEELTGRFDFSKFGQMLSGYRNYPDNMQVGYDEGLLSADGETLIQRRTHCVQGTGPLRFAVYLHFYDPQRRFSGRVEKYRAHPCSKHRSV
jgi:hypothetical protein